MLLKITLWGLLIGSIVTGIFGIHTGSALTTVIGISSVFFVGFLIYFLAQMSIELLLTFLKVAAIAIVVIVVVLFTIRGCKMMIAKTESTSLALVEKSVQMAQKYKAPQDSHPQTPEQAQAEIDSGEPYVPVLTGKIEKPSVFSRIKSFVTGKKEPNVIPMNRNVILDPMPDRTLSAPAPVTFSGLVSSVLSGNVFKMNNRFVKLYGIDVPTIKQECMDRRSETYGCGRMAKQRLERLLLHKHINCQVVSQYAADQIVATCTLKGYDVGASMVAVGWALADRRVTDAYVPYEKQARRQNLGLWSGKFMAPWVYRQRTAGTRSSHSQSSKGFFESLFQ